MACCVLRSSANCNVPGSQRPRCCPRWNIHDSIVIILLMNSFTTMLTCASAPCRVFKSRTQRLSSIPVIAFKFSPPESETGITEGLWLMMKKPDDGGRTLHDWQFTCNQFWGCISAVTVDFLGVYNWLVRCILYCWISVDMHCYMISTLAINQHFNVKTLSTLSQYGCLSSVSPYICCSGILTDTFNYHHTFRKSDPKTGEAARTWWGAGDRL